MERGDGIGIRWAANAAIGISVRATVQYIDGSFQEFVITDTHAGDRVAVNNTDPTGGRATQAGNVVNLRVRTFTANVQRGQCAVVVFIVGGGEWRDTLARGYVWSEGSLGLNEFQVLGPAGGHGYAFTSSGANPAAGADPAALVVPANAIWRLRGWRGQLITAVAVANREVALTIVDPFATVVGGTVASEIQTASLTIDYLGADIPLASGVSAGLGTGVISLGLPEVALPAGWSFAIKTYNLQGADDWGPPAFFFEEWVVL